MNRELLIVDDNAPFRIRLSKSMEKKGFEFEKDSTTNPFFSIDFDNLILKGALSSTISNSLFIKFKYHG
jgi:hypothetical protein